MIRFAKSVLFVVLYLCVMGSAPSSPDHVRYSIDPHRSTIEGFIKYTVVGKYYASFERFYGTIGYDEKKNMIDSVSLEIAADSIKSTHPTLDNIVRSPRILDAQRYPSVRFASNSIKPKADGYQVSGTLELHGVKKQISFPFHFKQLSTIQKKKYIKADGVWVINRKDFDVVWNRVLDHGGILVGDAITVDWEVITLPE